MRTSQQSSGAGQNTDGAGQNTSRQRSLAIRIAKWIVGILVMVGLVLAAQKAVNQWHTESTRITSSIREIDRQLESVSDDALRQELSLQRDKLQASVPRWSNMGWGFLGLATLFYGLGLLPSAMLLRSALRSLGQPAPLGTTIAAQLLGHVGKYVPGKAMVVVLRVGALSREGAAPVPATVSVFLETFLMMAVGASVAAVIVVWLPVPPWIAVGSLAVAALTSLPTLPPILRQAAIRLAKVSEDEARSKINWRLFAAGWGWSLLSWFAIGASFTALVAAIPGPNPLPPTPQLWAVATAAISLAVVVGFASLIPGGAGVRELVLTTVLGVAIGPVQGILSAIVARVVFILVEAVLGALSWLWLQRTITRNADVST